MKEKTLRKAGWFRAFAIGALALTAGALLLAGCESDDDSKKKFTVTFNPSGGTFLEGESSTAKVEDGKTVEALPLVESGSLTFAGWWTKDGTGDDWGTAFTTSTVVTANITVYAKWAAAGATLYTVTFNANGGTVSEASREVEAGKPVGTLPTPALGGKYFAGWFTKNGSGGDYGTEVTAATVVTGTVTYYARWNDNPLEYVTVTFDAQGGVVSAATAQYIKGDKAANLPAAFKEGNTFNGWFTAASGGTAVDSSYTWTADVTIYAQYSAAAAWPGTIPGLIAYPKAGEQWPTAKSTVTLKPGDGASVSPTTVQVSPGGRIDVDLPTPVKAGYKFMGWYLYWDDTVGYGYGLTPQFWKGAQYVRTGVREASAKWLPEDQIPTLTGNLASLKDAVAASTHGATPEDPVVITVPASVALNEVKWVYTVDNSTITDDIGLFWWTFGDKYVALDLSAVIWTDPDDGKKIIPGTRSDPYYRPSRDRLVALKLPAATQVIRSRAFHGSVNLRKIDLQGLSQLTEIEERAFAGCESVTALDFTGCTALTTVGTRAFMYSLQNLEVLDLTALTALKRTDNGAFRFPWRAKGIELPASFEETVDYGFEEPYNLEYVRFRNPVPPQTGWGNFVYADWAQESFDTGTVGAYFNGKGNRLHKGGGISDMYGARPAKTDANFVMFHPNTIAWTKASKSYYMDDGGGFFMAGHGVPEGPATQAASTAAVGMPSSELYRGLGTLSLSITGLTGVDGYTLKNNVGAATATIASGAASFVVGTPTGLETLSPTTATKLIGTYTIDEAKKWPTANDNEITGIYGTGTLYGSESGYDGQPWVTVTGAKFAVLELTAEKDGAAAKSVYRKGSAFISNGTTVQSDTRRMYFVYVDKDVTILQQSRDAEDASDKDPANSKGSYRTVTLSLKQGWNWVEKAVRIYDLQSEKDEDYQYGAGVILWISGGIIEDDGPAGPKDITANETTLVYKEIPWVAE